VPWGRGDSGGCNEPPAKTNEDSVILPVTKLTWLLLLLLLLECCVSAGVTMTLSTQVEGKNFNQGGHKFGIGLDFEA